MTTADKVRVTKRAFLFNLQDGLCYLAITPGCKARGRLMRLNVSIKKPDCCTIEHVKPRCKMVKGEPELVLVACAECNTFKGDADPLSPMHVEKAEAYRLEWLDYASEEQRAADERKVRKRIRKTGGFENPELGIGPLPFPTRRWTPADTHKLDAALRARGITTKEGRATQLGVTDPRFKPGAKRNREKHPNIPLGSAREQMAATLTRSARNADSQAAARRGIEERGARLGVQPRKPFRESQEAEDRRRPAKPPTR